MGVKGRPESRKEAVRPVRRAGSHRSVALDERPGDASSGGYSHRKISPAPSDFLVEPDRALANGRSHGQFSVRAGAFRQSHTLTRTHIHTHTYTHAHIHTRTRKLCYTVTATTQRFIFISTHTHIYTHTHTHIYTHTFRSKSTFYIFVYYFLIVFINKLSFKLYSSVSTIISFPTLPLLPNPG